MIAIGARIKIREGMVFRPENADRFRVRRVVAIHGAVVAYSTGGDKTRYCQDETLRRWIKRRNGRLFRDNPDEARARPNGPTPEGGQLQLIVRG